MVFFAADGLDDGVHFPVACFFDTVFRLGAAFLGGATFLPAVAFFGDSTFLPGPAVFFVGVRLPPVAFVRGLTRRLVGVFFDAAFFTGFLAVSLGLPDALANR